MMVIVERMNAFLQTVIFKNTIEDYAMSLLVFLTLFLGFSIAKRVTIHYAGKITARTVSDFDDFIVQLIYQIGWPVMAAISLYMATSSLVLPEGVRTLIRYVVVFVVTIRVILIVQAIIQYSVGKILAKRMKSSVHPMIKGMTWVIRWALWVVGGVFILSNLGINVSSLVAGIGIGGIAVAMASQAVLGDAFSAVCIYLDRPFEIGDFIIIDDKLGTVEHIGIKTTRIRSLSGEQLVFSNSDLTKSRVSNYKRMQTRRIVFKISIAYETPIEKVEGIPQIIKDILKQQDVNIERVHFSSLGDFSLLYEIVYHVKSADYGVYMDKQQAINLAIMKAFHKEGINFAYPTQTLYMNPVRERNAVFS